jgi:FkbM family methyltransferase
MSCSQIGQDIEVLKVYNNKLNGFFVEIGASNGVAYSNTFLLETNYNWKGICVEPLPYLFEELCKNRPNSICLEKAVYKESDKDIMFDIVDEADMLSGISECISDHSHLVKSNKTQITVKTITFNDLLDKNNAPLFIEYLSLDTEGSELEILKSVNFDKYTFGLIDVEHNFKEPARTQLRTLLTSNGYDYIGENYWDDRYKHNSLQSTF